MSFTSCFETSVQYYQITPTLTFFTIHKPHHFHLYGFKRRNGDREYKNAFSIYMFI